MGLDILAGELVEQTTDQSARVGDNDVYLAAVRLGTRSAAAAEMPRNARHALTKSPDPGCSSGTSAGLGLRHVDHRFTLVLMQIHLNTPRRRVVGVVATVLAVVGCSGANARPDDRPGHGTRAAASASSSADHGATCAPDKDAFAAQLNRLEREWDAIVGVYAVDTATGATLAHRPDERFAFASTIKALAAAVVLDRLSSQELSRRLRWTKDDLVPYSPVTELHVEDGLTVREVLEAAVTVSDNTAANLLVDLLGGPGVLDGALEDVGDDTTQVVRREPELNDYRPGDVRDTTTPQAIALSLAAFAVGGELAKPDERLLNNLLFRNTTGDALIRAAVPTSWRVGDKTGSATYGTRNDIAVITPPGEAPIVLAVLTRHDAPDAPTHDALVARAARVVVESWC